MPDRQGSSDDIWAEDLFDREGEAGLLIGYLESIASRAPLREDSHGFTLAVDARYGEGKSFFLKRLARQLALNHPVAFVDAWTDDLADEPLTALAATLKSALDPLIEGSPEVRSKATAFFEKSGTILKIVAGGLIKRGVGLIITGAAADALEDSIGGLDDEVADIAKDKLKSAGDDLVADAITAFSSVAPGKLMEGRIAAFEEGQAAIRDMRASLEALVASLDGETQSAPIFIIIDELDRCRPTYAVKLLEEIKHLFDVPGLIFILGLHGDQLAHSVSAAYGVAFDGKAYLRRFFHRQYRLAEPDLKPLLHHLCERSGVRSGEARLLQVVNEREGRHQLPMADMIALYMTAYGLSARNAFELVDILQTCFALVGGKPLHLNYLLPLIIGHIQNLPSGELPRLLRPAPWRLFQTTDDFGNNGAEMTVEDCAQLFRNLSAHKKSELATQVHANGAGSIVQAVYGSMPDRNEPERLWSVASYPKLLETVGRFKYPEADGS